MNWVYILRCRDGSLYTGWTNDLKKRIAEHNKGKGAKYTRSRLPVQAVYLEVHDESQEARKREAAIKKLTRRAKLRLIEDYEKKTPKGLSD